MCPRNVLAGEDPADFVLRLERTEEAYPYFRDMIRTIISEIAV
jgi:hypothetical protein